jgi:hypothetical protein
MQNLFMVIYTAVLFYVLTPGILLSLPPKGSKMVVAATHALVFALVYKLTHRAAWKMSMNFDGFQDKPKNMQGFQNNNAAMKPPMKH